MNFSSNWNNLLKNCISTEFLMMEGYVQGILRKGLHSTIEGIRRFSVLFRVKEFILNVPPLTRDVTCSRLYLNGKNMRRKCQMNTLVISF